MSFFAVVLLGVEFCCVNNLISFDSIWKCFNILIFNNFFLFRKKKINKEKEEYRQHHTKHKLLHLILIVFNLKNNNLNSDFF